jgi:protein ImuB
MLGPEAVTVAEWQGGRGPAERYRWVPAVGADLGDLAARRAALAAPPQHPWPGTIAAPSPVWVALAPEPLEVLDAHGAVVTVDGRGGLSAEPARLRRTGTEVALTAWAGPWPVEERWWDPQRHRRRARFHVLTEHGEALLVCRERGAWWLEARYD